MPFKDIKPHFEKILQKMKKQIVVLRLSKNEKMSQQMVHIKHDFQSHELKPVLMLLLL